MLWFDQHDPSFYLCIRREPREEVVYEISTNYGAKREPSEFWTIERRSILDLVTRSRCEAYYPLDSVPMPVPGSNSNQRADEPNQSWSLRTPCWTTLLLRSQCLALFKLTYLNVCLSVVVITMVNRLPPGIVNPRGL